MKNQTYFCRLKVISPIHIGCDEVYEPTGFALDEQEKELIAFEPASFLGMLEQQDLDTFSVICRKGTVQSLLEIYKFIRQHKEHARGRRVSVSDAFTAHYSRTLNLPPNAVQQQLNKFEIARTSFQKINGAPYIPGSALKGALRTAVLNLRNNGKSQPRYRNGKQLNEQLAGGTFATDPFRLVKISDFQASGEVRQKIVYAVNRKKKPSDREARGPYQILEIIESGTEFIGTITIQPPPAGAGIRRPVDMDELLQALDFYSRELQQEKTSLKAMGCEQAVQTLNPGEKRLIRVGRHSGAESVTVEGHRDIKIMQGPGVRPKYQNHATTLWLAGNSDNPSTNRSLEPFGWAEFDLLTTEEAAEYEKNRTAAFSTWENDQRAALAAFSARAEELARQQQEELILQEKRAAEQRKRDQELQQYPWRALLPGLKQITDWGALRTQVLEQEDFIQYQAEEEMGHAVAETASRIAQAIGKKWTSERDGVVAEWIAVSGITWKPLNTAAAPKTPQVDTELLGQISKLTTWAEFKQSGITITKLDKECALELKGKFSSWKMKKSKDKQQKKVFKQLTKRLDLIS